MMRPTRWLLLASMSALAGCAVGPNFQAPAPPTTTAYSPQAQPPYIDSVPSVIGGQSQHIAPETTAPVEWWKGFGSPALNAMVDEALKANPDLKSSEAALRQAKALMRAQAGAQLPTLDGSYQAQRAKNSDAIAPLLSDNSELYSLHTAQLTVGYTLDVFGGLRRQTEAAAAQADQARFQYEAARLSLIANVVAAAFQSAALTRQIEAAQMNAKDIAQTLELMRKQLRAGEIGVANLAAQEALLAQANQALPPLVKSLNAQQSALAVLLGREAGQGAPAPLDLGALTLPAELPLTTPAVLVARRPDVAAAEANLHAASANVGVAIAARLPNITLNATYGGAAQQLNQILNSGNNLWTLTGGVTQPIFEGGQLKEKQKAAEAALDQAKAQYRSTVLGALKNVADSLDALVRDAETLKAAEAAEVASCQSLTFAQKSRALGEGAAQDVLLAEEAVAQARSTLAIASAARFSDTAALYQALGDGA